MSWTRLIYYPDSAIKTHTTHESVADITERDIKDRYDSSPTEKVSDKDLRVDPGGMIMMNNKPLEKSFGGSAVSVKPEHILGAAYRWTRKRVLDEKLPSGENVIKVYMSEYSVVTLPESMYYKIGAWLKMSEGEGYVARMEIVEALADVPGIIVVPPESKGDA